MILALIVLGAFLLLANAVFVGGEFALVAARRSRLQQLAASGDMWAAAAIRHARRLPRTLAALQLGISAASIGLGFTLGAVVELALEPVLGKFPPGWALFIDAVVAALALVVVSGLHTLFGEMVPKNLAIAVPEPAARWLSAPTSAVVWLATPLVPVLWGATNLLLKALRVESRSEIDVAHSADEIRTMLDASRSEGMIREYDERLLTRILSFSQMNASQVMVPWSQVVTVPETVTVSELERAFAETGRGRLPVQALGRERIVGYVKSCDLAQVSSDLRDQPIPRSLIRELVQVDSSSRVVVALEEMRRAGRHFAVVTGPSGSHEGIVTMRGVIELLMWN